MPTGVGLTDTRLSKLTRLEFSPKNVVGDLDFGLSGWMLQRPFCEGKSRLRSFKSNRLSLASKIK